MRKNRIISVAPSSFTVIHVPHASKVIPESVREQFVLTDQLLSDELRLMTDAYTDELFEVSETLANTVAYPVSRLVVDPERFVDDELEIMVKRGMGAVYTSTAAGTPLRRQLTTEERQRLVDQYYWPHHRKLSSQVRACLDANHYCLIIDAHSFPSRPLPYELDQAPSRPDICIGTDSQHTPNWLSQKAEALFRSLGWSVEIDRPFAGALVPSDCYRTDAKRVHSVMVEINRGLYMNEQTGAKSLSFSQVKDGISKALVELISFARQRQIA